PDEFQAGPTGGPYHGSPLEAERKPDEVRHHRDVQHPARLASAISYQDFQAAATTHPLRRQHRDSRHKRSALKCRIAFVAKPTTGVGDNRGWPSAAQIHGDSARYSAPDCPLRSTETSSWLSRRGRGACNSPSR